MWVSSHSYVRFAIAMWTLTCACEGHQGSIPFNMWKMWHSYVRIPCHIVTWNSHIAMSQWHNCTHRCTKNLAQARGKFLLGMKLPFQGPMSPSIWFALGGSLLEAHRTNFQIFNCHWHLAHYARRDHSSQWLYQQTIFCYAFRKLSASEIPETY